MQMQMADSVRGMGRVTVLTVNYYEKLIRKRSLWIFVLFSL